MKIDEHGRCPNCLRKPIEYRRDRHFFCDRCCRSYDMASKEQRANWAWLVDGNGGFVPTYPEQDYVKAQPTAEALRRTNRERARASA